MELLEAGSVFCAGGKESVPVYVGEGKRVVRV